MPSTLSAKSQLRIGFFDYLFGAEDGWVCIATKEPHAPTSGFRQRFFQWPEEKNKMENYILGEEKNKEIYYCVNLLDKPERKKENCLPTRLVWADLDTCDPEQIQPAPQVVVQTSKNRWQAVWRMSMEVDAGLAAYMSKRVAYAFADKGADKSGWDLTQLLRVPFTLNHKHNIPFHIQLVGISHVELPPLLFEALPQLPPAEADPLVDADLPESDTLPEANAVIQKYSPHLKDKLFAALYTQEPSDDEDWSKQLWKLIHMCFEAGMDIYEVFVVAESSSVNKYKRDHRPRVQLWREVQKAYKGHKRIEVIVGDFRPLVMPDLGVPEIPENTFVSRYRTWAEQATDAVPQFHDLSAFILLSSIVASSVYLDTSHTKMIPNLWGLLLGDSTLTRKTTAMRMATDMLIAIDPEILVATDGSIEGLLTGLAERNNRTSMFFKDEVSGFFDSINKREYLAGMPETLTHLYDVPSIFTRRLRKETIHIESPVFIFFGGGVKDRVYEALTEEYVLSGFLPRFLVVSGDADLHSLRRTGPATGTGSNAKSGLITELADLYESYAADVIQSIGGQKINMPLRVSANLTDDAWQRYGAIEELMVRSASESSVPNLALPTFERLTRSLLKMAVILGASRQQPKDEEITIETRDVEGAAAYIQKWGNYSVEIVLNAGKKLSERVIEKILRMIEDNPGILKSTIMQHRHLTRREADEILGTLEERMLIRKEAYGRGSRYYAA